MTWANFVIAVNQHLATEASRRGLEVFRTRYMRNAVLDLQRFIRGYREANTTTYTSAQVTDHGQAQLVDFPDGCKPKALYIYSADADLDDPLCYRYRLQFYPWLHRQDLICGRLNFMSWLGACCTTAGCPPTELTADQQQAWTSKSYVYTIGPMGRNFLIYPKITASTRLLLIFDGLKYQFVDADIVNFPEDAAEAVAMYVMGKIARFVDRDLAMAKEFDLEYAKVRLKLFRDYNETQMIDGELDEEYDGDMIPAPTNFNEFGAQSIPFLRNITTLAGATATALAAIPTAGLEVPLTVMILIGGVLQLWTLESGTDATGIGRQRGNDYAAGTNEQVWTLLG